MNADPARRRKAILLLALLVLIWGVNWVIAKMSLAYISPIWVTALRLLPACVLFFSLCFFTGRLRVPVRADLPVVFSIGLLHMVGFSVLVSIGIQYMTAGKSIVLAYTTPLWVLPAAWFFLGEKLTRRKLTGLVVGMLGLVLLLQPGELDWSDRDVLIGHGFVLLAALLWAGSIVYGRAHKWVTPPFALLPWQMLVGGLTQLVLALAIEGLPQIKWSVEFLLLVGFNCLLGNGLAYWLMNVVSRDLPASAVSMGLLGVPVIGLVCSSLVLDEALGPALLIAAALIIFGIILGTTTPRKAHEQK
ncbi:DMT family transporter [Alcaligenaceae bacterium LF4-65]|jgi:drug/metabolite transporter (DMT)-like permease|uniref:DMT family transporter n=1 Tax=Zwartia hollandica TaxID=324606 RepID=A0A953NA72_9BURK|nr:DMT family transporter [Zwartia hollandica]MBZ1350547.1 DMT family transporter [Zwartia hollandica]